MHAIVSCFIPCAIIFILNIIKLHKSVKEMICKNTKTAPIKILGKSKVESEKYPISVILINMLFILFTLPDKIISVTKTYYFKNNEFDLEQKIFNFFSLTYFCINMMIIIIINRKNKKLIL